MRQLNLSTPAGIATLLVRVYDDATRFVPAVCVLKDRWVVQFDNGDPSSGGLNLEFYAPGYTPVPFRCRMTMPPDDAEHEGGVTIVLTPSAIPFRPAPVQQPALPPFEASDPGGIVHTMLPFVPPPNPTKDFHRGDAWGVTLPTAPELVKGANTTPPTMVMSYLLPRYGATDRDAHLTGHAQRSYSHFHLDQWTWQDAGLSASQAVALMQYVQSWGFFTSFWGLGTSYGVNFGSWADAAPYLQPILDALIASGPATCEKTQLVIGGELNSCTSPAGLLNIVLSLAPQCEDAGIDLWLHFTSNYVSWPVPGQSPQEFWRSMRTLGVKGLKWQGDPADPAGTMGAHLWDARSEMAQADPSLLVCAFEYLGESQLFGAADEGHGRLRGLELCCCPTGAPTPNAPPVAGYGGGGSMPDGTPL